MKKNLLVFGILMLLLFLPFAVHAAPVGKFTSIEGNVDVTSPGKEARPVSLGNPLNVGDIVRSKSKSKCEITFTDGSILRLAENSRMSINQFSHGTEQRSAILSLFRGKIQNIVSKVLGTAAAQSKYEIHTPTAVCGVRGTNFFAYHQAGVSGAIFKEGTGYGYSLNRPQEVRTINPGQAMVVVSPDAPPVVRQATTLEIDQHQKDTAPSEKPKEEAKKEEEKKPEAVTAKADEGKKEEEKKEEAKAEEKPADKPKEEAKTEEKPAEEPQKTVTASANADAKEQSGPVDIVPKEETSTTSTAAAPTTADTTPSTSTTTTTTATTSDVASFTNLQTVTTTTELAPPPPPPPAATEPIISIAVTPEPPTTPLVVVADTTPPEISFVASPLKLTNSTTAAFELSSNETGTTYSYSTDGINYTAATGNTINLSSIPEGSNTFYVKGIDTAGNKTATPLTYAWTTDYTAPALTGNPSSPTNAKTASFTLSPDTASFAYSLDGNTPVSVTGNTLTLTEGTIAEGSRSITITATDIAGNTTATPLTYSWTTDYTAPAITLSGTPASLTNATAANIGVSATDANTVTYAYKLDNTTVTSPNLSGLAEGTHTFTITATDAAGNASTKSYSWTTDYTAPILTIAPKASPTPATSDKTNINVALTGSETVTFASTMDGTTALAGTSVDFNDLATGSHTLQVQATDGAGNVSTQSVSFTLARYPLSGSFSGSIGNVSGTATGEIAGVSGQSWGGWNLQMTGSGDATPNATWALSAGGQNPDGSYWLDIAPGISDLNAKTLTGQSQLTYLSKDVLGSGTGTLTGQFDGTGKYSFADVGAGSYTEKPLTFKGKLDWGAFGSIDSSLGTIWDTSSNISGLIGGTSSLGNGPLVAIGTYYNPSSKPIWDMDIKGTTAEGGAFYMSGGGIALNNSAVEGGVIGLYIKPDGQGGYLAGYLSSDHFTSTAYSGISMWEASPIITASPGVATTVLPSELYWDSPKLKVSWLNNLPISGAITGLLNTEFLSLIDQKWGRWMGWSGGSFAAAPSSPTNWKAVIGGELKSPIALSWLTPTGLTNAPEVTVTGNSIVMGVANRTSSESQPVSLHGASALLPLGAIGYRFTFDYNLATWDSYNMTKGLQPNGDPTQGLGWYDSFSLSTSKDKYWNLSNSSLYSKVLTDPLGTDPNLNVGFLWGGTSYGDPNLETKSGTKTIFLPPSGENTYLNVYLDTATSPNADSINPSWGTVTVTKAEAITGYTISKITGTQWSDNKLSGTIDGKFLNTTTLGTTKGDLLGTYNTTDKTWQTVSLGTWKETPLLYANSIKGDLYQQNDATIHEDSYEKPVTGYYFDTSRASTLYVKSKNPANLPMYGLQIAKKETKDSKGIRSDSYDFYYPNNEALSYRSSNNVPRMSRVKISALSIQPDFSNYPPTMPLPSEFGVANISPDTYLGNGWPVTAAIAVGTTQYAKTYEGEYDLNVMERVLPSLSAKFGQTFQGIMGAYQLDGGASSLWATDSAHPLGLTFVGEHQDATLPLVFSLRHFYSQNYEASGSAAAPAPDGGAYYGVMSGTLSSDGSLGAALSGLYVSPTVNGTWEAGILKAAAPLTGTSGAGMWEADGQFYRVPKATNLSTGVDAANLLYQDYTSLGGLHFTNIPRGAMGNAVLGTGGLYGQFGTGGAITTLLGAGFGNTLSIEGLPDFGIFEMLHGGIENTYSNPSGSTTWQLDMASTGEFGRYVRPNPNDPSKPNYSDFGFWTASIANGALSEPNKLSGTLSGYLLTYKKEGNLTGYFLGNLKPDTTGATTGIWQGASTGTWEKTRDVTFSSGIVGDNFSLSSNQIRGNGGTNSYYNAEKNQDGSYRWASSNSITTSTNGNVTTTTTTRTEYDWQGPPDKKEYSKTVWIEQKMFDSSTLTTTYAYTLQEVSKLDLAAFNAAIDALRIYKGTTSETTDNYWMGQSNQQHDGILAGFDKLWDTTGVPFTDVGGPVTNVSLIGKYSVDDYAPVPAIFGGTTVSFDPLVGMNPYKDSKSPIGGAYYGYLGAAYGKKTVDADWLDGMINGIWLSPSGNVGILHGKFTGSNNPQVGAWRGTGTIDGVYGLGMANSSLLTEANFANKVILHSSDLSYGSSDVAVTGDDVKMRANSIDSASIDGSLLNPSGSGSWDVWQSRSGGTFSGNPTDWVWVIPEAQNTTTYSAVHINTTVNGVVTGDTVGAHIDPTHGETSLSGGSVKGIFDPVQATWQAVSQGIAMKTTAFVNKVDSMTTDAQRDAFYAATKLPAFTVGKTDLSGSSNNMTVNMNNVTFFANSVGAAPKIWATNGVSGSYTAAPVLNVPVVLSGANNVSANFNVQQWTGSTWGATVTKGSVPAGTSGFTYPNAANTGITFQGGAAGSITSTPGAAAAGTFSGTAAGIVK